MMEKYTEACWMVRSCKCIRHACARFAELFAENFTSVVLFSLLLLVTCSAVLRIYERAQIIDDLKRPFKPISADCLYLVTTSASV